MDYWYVTKKIATHFQRKLERNMCLTVKLRLVYHYMGILKPIASVMLSTCTFCVPYKPMMVWPCPLYWPLIACLECMAHSMNLIARQH